MTGLPKRSSRPIRGAALFNGAVALLSVSGVAAVVLTFFLTKLDGTEKERALLQARFLAEGATELAKKRVQESVANFLAPPENGTVTLHGTEVEYWINPTGLSHNIVGEGGVEAISVRFEIRAEASVDSSRVQSSRLVDIQSAPLFQYSVFYTNDLEIFSESSTTIRGRIHCNSDIYLGSSSVLTLDTNFMRAAGNIYRNRKTMPERSPGKVRLRRWVTDPYDPTEPVVFVELESRSQLAEREITSESGYDSRFRTGHDADGDGVLEAGVDWLPWASGSLERWSEPEGYKSIGSTVFSGDHGVGESVTLDWDCLVGYSRTATGRGGDYGRNEDGLFERVPTESGAYARGFYHREAGLAILLYPDGDWKAYDSRGSDLSLRLAGAVEVDELYDARQANGTEDRLRVLRIDVGALETSGAFPANGLLYAACLETSFSVDAGGVVLTNARELPGALTVASENAVYLQGDFNSINKKRAAVVADAVNLLSNRWTNTKSQGELPKAADTTYNLAIITGNHESSIGSYNGGFEGLLRLHEDWLGKECRVVGSFVCAWTSQHATGRWGYGGDHYKAPDRFLEYDVGLRHAFNSPPFTPMAVSATDVLSW